MTKGESQTFDIICDDGYLIWDILVDGNSVGTPPIYLFSDVQQDHTIRAIFSMIPLLPVKGAILENQQDLTADWENDLLSGKGVALPQKAVEELLGTGTDPGSVEILEVRQVALMDCSLSGESGISLQVGLEENLPESPPDSSWGLLLRNPGEGQWELQGDSNVSVEDNGLFDGDEGQGKIGLLLAEVLIEGTDAGAGSSGDSGGCDTGINPLPALLLLIFHFLKSHS